VKVKMFKHPFEGLYIVDYLLEEFGTSVFKVSQVFYAASLGH
jgi:hypothetical protein